VLLTFLLISIVIGGSRAGRRIVERPSLVLLASLLVAISFYSIRVV
jgi:hypothetical protein